MRTPFPGIVVGALMPALLIALHSAPARAQGMAPQGLYRGRVVEAKSGEPVASAIVLFTDRNSGIGYMAVSDDEGAYQIHVPRGSYTLVMMIEDRPYEPEAAVRDERAPIWSVTFAPVGKGSLSEQRLDLASDAQAILVQPTGAKPSRGGRKTVTVEVVSPPPPDVMILAIRANPERDVRPGDAVEVTVEGTPGGTATASIAGDEGAIALREDPQSPGTYRGRVTAPAGEGVYLVSARIATEAAGETTLNGPQIHVAPAPVPVVTEIAEQPPEVPGTPPASGAPGRTAAAADRPAADAGRDFVPARPVKPFEQAPAAIDPAAITRSLGLAHFDLDRHNLTDAAGAALTASVILLEQKRVLVQPDLWLLVEGHCDELGSDAYNDHLGMLRAEAARGLLVSEGLPSEKIQTVSYGRRCPLERVGGMSELNRRVQLRVVSQAEAPGAIDPGACPAN